MTVLADYLQGIIWCLIIIFPIVNGQGKYHYSTTVVYTLQYYILAYLHIHTYACRIYNIHCNSGR